MATTIASVVSAEVISSTETLVRLLVAAAAGSVIGFERERLQWAAGLRTHMLVCVGSCLVIIVSAYGFSDILGEHVVLDPSRIAAQVVSGIGFLGAGTILLRGEVVRILTTAASLWAVAAIGLAIGAGLYVAGLATTVIVLLILAGIKPLEERVRERTQTRQVVISAERGTVSMGTLHDVLGGRAARVKQFVLRQGAGDERDVVEVTFTRLTREAMDDVVIRLRATPGVVEVEAG